MFGLLGGLLGGGLRAAAGRAVASRPILGGLMARRGGGGGGGSISGGGQNSSGPAEQPTTIKRDNSEQPPPKPQEPAEVADKPQAEPIVNQVTDGLRDSPTLQEQKPQPSNPTSPVKPLEGLIDQPQKEAAPPQTAPGTDIQEPQTVVNQGDGPQPTVSLAGDSFPASPGVAPSFLGNKIEQLPPRTIFEAPDANPSRPIDTSTKVNNSSPGYSTLGMTAPGSTSFSYLRR